jgi:sec-independent protein translocase protein TatB
VFDLGFFEILVIAIVGLVVIGPERLPETVRAVGLWAGRLKRSLRDTRTELERQIGADDIRRQLHNEEVMRSLEKSRQQIEDAVQEGVLPRPRPRPKRQYKEEDELPDHAHGATSETSTAAPAPDQGSTSASKLADEAPDHPEGPDQKSNS